MYEQWEATRDEESRSGMPDAASKHPVPSEAPLRLARRALFCTVNLGPAPGTGRTAHMLHSALCVFSPRRPLTTAVEYGLHQPQKLARTNGFPVCFLVPHRSQTALHLDGSTSASAHDPSLPATLVLTACTTRDTLFD